MVKGLEKYDWGWTITTDCPCPQWPTMIISIQKKNKKREKQSSMVFMRSFYYLKAYKRGELNFYSIQCVRTMWKDPFWCWGLKVKCFNRRCCIICSYHSSCSKSVRHMYMYTGFNFYISIFEISDSYLLFSAFIHWCNTLYAFETQIRTEM